VDFKGRSCTVYPISPEGSIVPPDMDCTEIVRQFQDKFVAALAKKGLALRSPADGVETDLMVTTHLVSIRKGSSFGMIWLFFGAIGALLGSLAGGTPSVAVTAQVGDRTGVWFAVPIEANGYGGFSQRQALKAAATLAANNLAKGIEKQLKAR
jgi:hypothetical protein